MVSVIYPSDNYCIFRTGIHYVLASLLQVLSQVDCMFSTSNRGNQIALATLLLKWAKSMAKPLMAIQASISAYSYCHHYSKSKVLEGFPDCIQYAAKVCLVCDCIWHDSQILEFSTEILERVVSLFQVLGSSFDNEAKFRTLIGIGSLVSMCMFLCTVPLYV